MRRTIAVLTALVSLVVFAPPAAAGSATPYNDTDAVGDTSYPKGDISAILIDYVGSGRGRLTITTTEATSATSGVWNDPGQRTAITWRVYGAGSARDFMVRMRAHANGPRTRVFDLAGNPLDCGAASGRFLSQRRIRIAVSVACIDDTTFSSNVTYTFNPLGPPAADSDRYPAAGSTPQLSLVCPTC